MTCQHFCYGVDQHCHTLLGCNTRQKQLQLGDHLKKKCQLWATTWVDRIGTVPVDALVFVREEKTPYRVETRTHS